jgi:hypothetical protein
VARSRRHVRIVSALIIFSLGAAAAAVADDGTPHNGPHTVPGVIRAVDFNDGGSLVAYYATTPGNQGGYSGYRPDTDVDIANGPGGPYVIASRADIFNHDWLKYTIEVSQAGWYRVNCFTRVIAPASSVDLVTLIDDQSLGFTQGVPVQDDFAEVWSRGSRLSAGRHTLGVLFIGPAVALDRIEISPVAPPLALTPRIVPLEGPSSEVVVADAVVTDAPFLADPTGVRDSTQAFTDALAAIAAYGGGTVFAPAGVYRIDGTLFIPESATLRGADLTDRSDPNRIGTLLLASFGEGDESAAPFISLGFRACVRDFAVWYPSQGFTNETVRAYPFTISFDIAGDGASALNLLLYDSYDGIAVRHGDTHVDNIVGTVLHTGLTAGGGFEFSWLSNVRFDNDTWKSAPRTVISNAPSSDQDRLALDTYTSGHVLGAQIGLNTYGMYGLRVRDAHQGMLVKKLPGDPSGFSSVISKIDASIDDVDGYVAPDLHFVDTDNVPRAESLSYDFVGFRGPANTTNFVRVTDPPFNAAGDGLADDTVAIQAALDSMGSKGGGTVYLPQGQYRVTRLTVPTGVEFRGPLGGGSHPISYAATCTLLGYEGRNTTAASSDPALLTLSPHSGIRGFDVVYPEQGYGTAAAPVLPYPFTIRGTGAGVWVENVSIANTYNLIDLASFRCDDHFVSGIEGTVFNTGILVGGGSERGRLERVIFTWGQYVGSFRLSGPHGYGVDALSAYTLQHAISFVFGSCTRETTFGLDSFWFKVGWRMLGDGGGCTDSTFWQSSSDTSSQSGFLFEGGDNLRFIGVAESTDGTSFVSSASFNGSVEVYGAMIWGDPKTRGLSGGVFRFQNESSLTLGKTATASSSQFAEGPSNAIDGSEFTKWVSATGGTNWITVDLDQPSEVDRWVVRHAGVNGEPTELDTNAFALQVSDDGLTFSDADSVNGNGGWLTDRPMLARGRFVRLLVTQGTLPGGDGRARIYEFEAHGKEGWQFTNDAEGWTPLTGVSSFVVNDGKLEISSASGQPIVVSPDNLKIQTSRFKALRVRMRNDGTSTSAKLSFTTQADPIFNEAKSVTAGDVQSSPEYEDYYFDLSGNAGWTGTLRQLQLTPIQDAGDVSIDSIALETVDPYSRVPVVRPEPAPGPRVVTR